MEAILVCAVSSGDDTSGALLSINMKTMNTDVRKQEYGTKRDLLAKKERLLT